MKSVYIEKAFKKIKFKVSRVIKWYFDLYNNVLTILPYKQIKILNFYPTGNKSKILLENQKNAKIHELGTYVKYQAY